ncbi:MAG: hypothetical protein P1V51_04945 [Deltaproteobacteria bacterium]|nr:hypothetical protein [Deltaproteobacteria bacterium]
MPLTDFQATLARLLSANRSPDSYLAGGAALHLEPNTSRYSNDLDYFNDSVERVAAAHREDAELLEREGYALEIDLQQPGFVRAVVRGEGQATKVEWAHDSAWRFLPTVRDERVGYRLHPIDLATNKVLALAGRDEVRDLLDVVEVHHEILPLGAVCWAAAGKDPGFTPLLLLELLRRRGRVRPEDLARLHLAEAVDLTVLKQDWLTALEEAEAFVRSRPPEELGCLYYSPSRAGFFAPGEGAPDDLVPHHGRPGGVLPRVLE